MSKMFRWWVLPMICLLTLLQWTAGGEERDLQRIHYQETHMGTDFQIILYAADTLQAEKAVTAAFERIHELDLVLSRYRSDSELNRLSGMSGKGVGVPVSPSVLDLLERSLELSQQTYGAFDITAGPLKEMWRWARRTGREIPEKKLEETLKLVGYDMIGIDREAGKIHLPKAGMILDSGGIGKGYAVDEALKILTEQGISSALVSGGGDLSVSNPPPGETGWRIGVQVVRKGAVEEKEILLANRAIATSGDFGQYTEIEGRRYSHILDPRTGLRLSQANSVTVLAPDCLQADALATALTVLSPQKARSLSEQLPGVEFYRISDRNQGVTAYQSKGFPSLNDLHQAMNPRE